MGLLSYFFLFLRQGTQRRQRLNIKSIYSFDSLSLFLSPKFFYTSSGRNIVGLEHEAIFVHKSSRTFRTPC